MKLSAICKSIPNSEHLGNDVEIADIAHDSRHVNPGALFVALVGAKSDGHDYIPEATAKGASALAIHSERAGWYRAKGVPLLVVPDTRAILPRLSAIFHGEPSRDLFLVGVTGTNGKTSVSCMLESIYRTLADRTGLIGTLGAMIDGKPVSLERTTPESSDLQRLFSQMLQHNARRVVMEVSSEGILAGRTSYCAFDIGVFTNLTQDHLNTHGTMEAYFQEKLRLFTEYPDAYPDKPFAAVVNADDEYGKRVIDAVEASGRQALRYSMKDPDMALFAEIESAGLNGTRFTIHYRPPLGSMVNIEITLRVGGFFSVSNALAAAGAALLSRAPAIGIKNGLEAVASVPGRFEAMDTGGKGFDVVIDYAHSPDGLVNVLASARAFNPKRLVCVFGCGGNRDKDKRPKMGKIAVDMADLVVVTSDNPRNENPDMIIDDILSGIENGVNNKKVVVEADRYKAIEQTICELSIPGDIIVIAGKGHETGQIVGAQTIPFDDRVVAREVLAQCS
jgi:UDP-N-acetylmuramoyl-L-alanyl-D-glutamate--2,6-diaminopimelate ligase